jgi:magnesium-transporting ATPase (P-type)
LGRIYTTNGDWKQNNFRVYIILFSTDQLLLKGSYLKNTDFIIGLVVYTGHETKIMQNAKTPQNKQSKFIKTVNKILYTVMICQLVLCLTFAYFSLRWQKNNKEKYEYIIIVFLYNLG